MIVRRSGAKRNYGESQAEAALKSFRYSPERARIVARASDVGDFHNAITRHDWEVELEPEEIALALLAVAKALDAAGGSGHRSSDAFHRRLHEALAPSLPSLLEIAKFLSLPPPDTSDGSQSSARD